MLTVLFEYRGVLHFEFQPPSQNDDKKYYLSVMCCLSEPIRKKKLV